MYYQHMDWLLKQLIKAMKGEMEARKYYEKLREMAPSEEERKIINQFYKDEVKHYNSFYNLYFQLTGYPPREPQVDEPQIPSYIEGIEKAILDQLDAYEFYRDIYLSTYSPYIRDIFFEAFTDENEHAAHLNYLYTKNK